jgi:hypothetical protein
MDHVTIGVCPDGGDSPLSWAGNLAGLLTFALGILVTLTALLAATRNAEKEIEAKRTLLKQTSLHVNRIDKSMKNLLIDADPDYGDLQPIIDSAIEAYGSAVKEMHDYMEDHFQNSKPIWIHIKWWFMEKEIAAGFANLQSCSEHLTAAQLTLVQR